MNRHVLIALAVCAVLLIEWLWRSARQRRGSRRALSHAPPPRLVVERLAASGRFKAVAYAHADGVYRVEVLQRVAEEAGEPFWILSAGPSFADRGALAGVLEEALRAASGEAGHSAASASSAGPAEP